MLIHQLVQHEDGSLGVKMPESIKEHFPAKKEIHTGAEEGKVEITGGKYTLSSQKKEIAAVDLGVRDGTMLLECDVTIADGGMAGFAFGDPKKGFKNYRALTLNASQNYIHYEGYKLGGFENIFNSEPYAKTKFTFKSGVKHHITLVAENEIVVIYVDDTKVLSSRIYNSIDGAHLALFSAGGDAVFENLTINLCI